MASSFMDDLVRAAGPTIDLKPYFYGAGQGITGYQVGSEQMQIVNVRHMQDGAGQPIEQFLLRKNHFCEQFAIGPKWIHRGDDMSPNMDQFYRTHTLGLMNERLVGHTWFPRFASVGTSFVSHARVQFFSKGHWTSRTHGTTVRSTVAAGQPVGAESDSVWRISFVAHHDRITPRSEHNRTFAERRDVIEMLGEYWNGQGWVRAETYYFQRGYGMMGWRKYSNGLASSLNWWDADLPNNALPMDIYTPPGDWRTVDVARLESRLARLSQNPDDAETKPPAPPTEPLEDPDDEPDDALPLYGIKRDILTLNIDMLDLDPAKGMSKEEVKQVVIDGGQTAAMVLESVDDAIDLHKRMRAYCDDPFVGLRLYNIFHDTEDQFDGKVWLNHSVAEIEKWIIKHIYTPGGEYYDRREDIRKLWLQLSYNESTFEIGETNPDHPESLYKLIQWNTELAKMAVRLKQRVLIGSLGSAAVIENRLEKGGKTDIGLGWWNDHLMYLVGETDGVPHSAYACSDWHEYTDHHLLSAFVPDQRKAILQAANGTGPLANPDNWPTHAPSAADCWHLLRIERLQEQCVKLTGKRFQFSVSEHGWDLMDDVMGTRLNEPKWAYLKAYTPDWDSVMAGTAEQSIREYLYRKTGDAFFGEQRGPLTLRPYNAATRGKAHISDEDSAEWQFKQAVQTANIYPKECRMLAHYGPNNDWFNDADGEKCEGKGFDWARPMGRQFIVLMAITQAHTYDEVQALRAGGSMDTNINMKHVRVQSKSSDGTRIRSAAKISVPVTANVVGKLAPDQRYEAYLNYTDTSEANGETWGRIRVKMGEEWIEGYVALGWVAYGDYKATQEMPAVDPPADPPEDDETPTQPPQDDPAGDDPPEQEERPDEPPEHTPGGGGDEPEEGEQSDDSQWVIPMQPLHQRYSVEALTRASRKLKGVAWLIDGDTEVAEIFSTLSTVLMGEGALVAPTALDDPVAAPAMPELN